MNKKNNSIVLLALILFGINFYPPSSAQAASTILFEDSFAGTANTELSLHVPTSLIGDTASSTQSYAELSSSTLAILKLNGSHALTPNNFLSSIFYKSNVAGSGSYYHVNASFTLAALSGTIGPVFNYSTTTDRGYWLAMDGAFSPAHITLYRTSTSTTIGNAILGVPVSISTNTTYYTQLNVYPDSTPGSTHFKLYFGTSTSNMTLVGEGVDATSYPSTGLVGIKSSFNGNNSAMLKSMQLISDDVPAASPTAGTISATTTGSTVNATVTSASGTTGPYTNQWYVGTTSGFIPSGATLISNATTSSLTYTPSDSTLRFLKVVQTDSLSATTSTAQVPIVAPAPSLPTLLPSSFSGRMSFVGVGDSIMQNTPPGGTTTPFATFISLLQAAAPSATITGINKAISGTTATIDWITAGPYLSVAAASGTASTATDVLFQLGTNDSKQTTGASASVYSSSVQSEITYLFSHIATLQRVWIQNPPYTVPGSAGQWTDWSSDLPRQYAGSIAGIVNGTTIRQGATDSYRWTAANPNWSVEGIHPNDTIGRAAIATEWAAPIASYLNSTYQPVSSVSSMASSTTSNGATITWTTNASSSSQVSYGTTTAYSASTTLADNVTGVLSHSVTISSLSSCTAYHYQIKSSDLNGNIATSTDQTFVTTGCVSVVPPTLTVQSATSVGTSTITLNGTITADGGASSTVRGFNYGTTTAYGSSPTSNTGAYGVGPFSFDIVNLPPSTTFHLQSFATNSAGTGTSTDITFTTATPSDTTPPTVFVTAPTGGSIVSGSSVAISASATDTVGVIGVKFYDNTTLIGTEDASSPYAATWDTTAVTDGSHSLSAVARDAAGNNATSSVSVTVDNTAPIRSSGAPTGTLASSTTSSTLSLSTNENASCKYSASSGASFGSMTAFNTTGTTTHSTLISGLTASTTYSYYVKCQDGQGNIDATDYPIAFSIATSVVPPPTPVAPTIILQAATSVATSSAILNATVLNDGYASSTVHGFEYGTTTSYGSVLTTGGSLGVGAFYNTAANLVPNTLYHFRAFTTNSAGTASSSDLNFTTLSLNASPSSISAAATTSSAIISWTTSDAASSQVTYGLTSSYGTSTAIANVSPRITSHSVSISGLATCSTYHYRVSGSDAFSATSTSSDQTFVTTGCSASSPIIGSNSGSVATSTGGTLTQNEMTITVPAGFTSTSSSAVFQANKLDSSVFFASIALPTGLVNAGGDIFNLKAIVGASTTLSTFSSPITVAMSYSPSDVVGVNESSLWIYRYDGTQWYPLSNCSTNTSTRIVTCQTSNFSDFGIFGNAAPVVSTSSGSASGGATGYSSVLYGCRDPKASNYQSFVANDSNLCVYPSSGASASTGASAGTNTGGLAISTATVSSTSFTQDLQLNSKGLQVKLLQQYLNAHGYVVSSSGAGSKGKETELFGPATKAALIKFQKAKGIKPSVGYFGAVTRAFVKMAK